MDVLKHSINSYRRSYFITAVNEPIYKAIEAVNKAHSFFDLLIEIISIARDIRKYPEPTSDNVLHPNSKLLLRVYQEYIKLEQFKRVQVAVWFFIKLFVIKIEHSPNYGDRASWWVEKLSPNWKGRSLNHPRNGWAEQKPYGGR